jgi:hypothetical protein
MSERGPLLSLPEASSYWPLRFVGDTRWISLMLTRWDGRRRDPLSAVHSISYDYHVADYMYAVVRASRARRVVETGVHVGRTSLAILSALQRNGSGRLVSIDLPKTTGAVNSDGRLDLSHVSRPEETGYLVPQSLRGRWDLRLGDSKVLLPAAVEDGVDFFLHDSDHSYGHQMFEYRTVWPKLTVGGLFLSDDTDWTPAWREFLAQHTGEWEPLSLGPRAIRGVKKVR